MISILGGQNFIGQRHITCLPHSDIASHQRLVGFESHAFPLLFFPPAQKRHAETKWLRVL
jgi:hypothetical protein